MINLRRRYYSSQIGASNIKGKPISDTAPLDIVLVDKTTEDIHIVDGSITDSDLLAQYPNEVFTAIGIVVIPASHGVLKDGEGLVNQCGIISLVNMDASNPENGAANNSYPNLFIGQSKTSGSSNIFQDDLFTIPDNLGRYDSIDNLHIYNGVVLVTAYPSEFKELSVPYAKSMGLPAQKTLGGTATLFSSNNWCPSPYSDSTYNTGGFNSIYAYDNGIYDGDGNSRNNGLSDFRGIVNTKIWTDAATAEDWKNLPTLTNKGNPSTGYSPAACCCARYHTIGTKAFKDCTIEELRKGTGFWYMPSLGELGYIAPKYMDINNKINLLNFFYDTGTVFKTNTTHYPSTVLLKRYAYYVYFHDGKINFGSPGNTLIRAFMRL